MSTIWALVTQRSLLKKIDDDAEWAFAQQHKPSLAKKVDNFEKTCSTSEAFQMVLTDGSMKITKDMEESAARDIFLEVGAFDEQIDAVNSTCQNIRAMKELCPSQD